MAVSSTRNGTKLAIERSFTRFTEQKYSATRLRVAAREVAQREIELIRHRTTVEGLSKTGRALNAHSDSYLDTKRGIIRNGYKVGRGRGAKRRLVSINPTAFAATRAQQFMRLSGRMYTDMYVRDLKVKQSGLDVLINYALDFKTARSKKIAGYHINGTGKRKRDFWGPVKRKHEQDELRRVLARALR